jgi:TolB-like protein/DNA-binding winged helix-turn-helix (wHTH) protein/tetratricopeptide (TPR) repeat protein
MPPVSGPVLHIGDWEVDPARGEIRSGARRAKLDPLTMRLLVYLADNADRVVALQELLEHVWPNVVVTPQSVYNTIAHLRRALGDLAEAPTYIATVPRMGYRLVAKVERAPPSAAATSVPVAAAPSAATVAPTVPSEIQTPGPTLARPARRLRWTLVTAATLVGIAIAVALVRREGPGPRTSLPEAAVAHSIAILPFRDLSEAKDREYLAEGLAEEIGTVLARVPGLRIVGRASAFASRADTVQEIAKKLHVDHVLEGSVQSSAKGLRITAELIRTDSGQYLWSKTYDRAADDTFSVEDEIAGDVASALTHTALAPRASAQSCGLSGPANSLLLQGRYLGRRNTPAERERSIELYRQALALEPDCARAWAWLSTAYGVQAANHWTAADEGFERARDAALHALRLDPLEPDAHAALAYVLEFHDWNWKEADSELKRALALDGADARVLSMNGHLAIDLGQTDRALAFYRRAVEQDPLSPGAVGGLAAALWVSGHAADAEALYRQAAALSPARSRTVIGLLELDRGDSTAALREVEQETDPVQHLMGLAIVRSALGDRAASDRALAELVARFPDHPYEIAQAYGHRRELDAAFTWLERAFASRDSHLLWIKINYALRPVHADPRYAALLKRMGLPP